MSKNKPLPPLRNPVPVIAQPGLEMECIQPRIAYEHCCFFCQAYQQRFDEMAKGMADGKWELVAVLPHRQYVTVGGGNGYADGWMTFWKRIRTEKHDK